MINFYNSATMIHSRTGRALYLFGAIFSTLAILLYSLFTYLIPSFRPHPRWTFRQSLMNRLMNAFLYPASILEMQTDLSLLPGKEGSNFITIPPANHNLYRSVLSPTSMTSPKNVGGIWYPSPPHPTDDKESLTILYFHGGAFVIGTARPDVSGFPAKTLNSAFYPARTLAFSYRLASRDRSCAFPAALQDALSAYVYLLDQGISATRIVLAGDSAGCNIAIALLRYLASSCSHELSSPQGAVLCSPWVDVYATRSDAVSFSARYNSIRTDYVPAELQLWGARAYVPDSTTEEMDEFISPLHRPFLTSTRIWVLVGGCEVLAPEGIQWAEQTRGCGCEVQVEVEGLANHAILGVGGIMGFAGEARRAAGMARLWILNK